MRDNILAGPSARLPWQCSQQVRSNSLSIERRCAVRSDSEYLDFWDRDDELATPFTHVGELLHDLVLEVPGEDEDVIRLRLPNALRREDRDSACPASYLPCL